MVLEINLALGELGKDVLQVCHMKGLIGGRVGAGSLETTKLKSVMVEVWQRGWQGVVGFGWDKQEFEIRVVKDSMVDDCEPIKLELCCLSLEPFNESDFIVVEIGSLEDVKVPLPLFSMHQWVVDVTGNGGLIVR